MKILSRLFAFLLLSILSGGPAGAATLTLLTSADRSVFGRPVTLVANVTPASATGSVTFYDGVTVLGTAALNSGSAAITTSLLPSGARSIRAYYGGDANNTAGTSAALVQNVAPVPGYGFGPAVNYSTVSGVNSIAAGYFDGNDGEPADLAVSTVSSGIEKFFSNGSGGFQPAMEYSVNGNSSLGQVIVFNGTDLAIADYQYGETVLLNDSSVANYNSSEIFTPLGIAAADTTGNGKVDLVAVASGIAPQPDLGGARPERASLPGATAVETCYYGGPPCPDIVSVLPGIGNGTFGTAYNFFPWGAAGTGSAAIAVGDFNGDGIPDLVITNGTREEIGVFLNDGHGYSDFQSAITTSLDFAPGGIVVADFNGDGKLDLAVSGSGGAVLLGKGDGTFSAPAYNGALAGGSASGIAAADVNGDGTIDIVVAGSNLAGVSVLLGNGDGTFQPVVVYPVGGAPRAVAVGDFNGDGRADLAVGWTDSNGNGYVSVLPGLASSTVPAATTTVLVNSATTVPAGTTLLLEAQVSPATAVGSVTFLDGSTVLGSAPLEYGFASLYVTLPFAGANSLTAVYGGNYADAASTSSSVTITVNPAPTSTGLSSSLNPSTSGQSVTLRATVSISDATGSITFMDGSTVLGTGTLSGGTATLSVPAFSTGAHSLTAVYSGAGTDAGSTSPVLTQTVLPARTPTSITLASPNPSTYGKTAVLTATVSPSTATGRVTFYDGVNFLEAEPLSGGQATLKTGLLASGTRSITAFYGGDLSNSPSVSPALPQVVNPVFESNLYPAVNYPAGNEPSSVAVGDFNGDGRADLAVTDTYQSIGILIGNGDGTFQPPVTYATGYSYFTAVGDFNGDGIADLAAATYSGLAVLLGNGDGTFQSAVYYSIDSLPANHPVSAVVVDLNGDGYTDVVTANSDGSLSAFLGYGNGTLAPALNFNAPDPYNPFFPPPLSTPVNPSPHLVTGDFNGDGIPDLAGALELDGNASTVSIFLGNGDGSFGNRIDRNVVPAIDAGYYAPAFLAPGDFNGDGKADLAVAFGESVATLLGNGDGTFEVAPGIYIGETVTNVATGDFTGNGRLDLVVAGEDTSKNGSIALLLGNGDGTFAGPYVYPAGKQSSAVVVGDFNGDGRADFAVANTGGNNVSILLGEGLTQTITFAPLTTQILGSSPPALSATASSGLAVTFVSNSTLVCALSGVDITLLATGTCSITASQPGNSAYGAAPPVTRTFTVFAQASQTIAFDAIPNRIFGVSPFEIAAESSSGLPVVLHTTTPLVCTNSSALVTLVSAGTCSITANQGGNADYFAASPVTRSFTVSLAKQSNGFAAAAGSPVAVATNPRAVVVGDFNGDGIPDLATANYGSNNVTSLIGNGSGAFTPAPGSPFAVGTDPVSLAAADFNLDGIPDLAVANDGRSLSVLLGYGSGVFTEIADSYQTQPDSVVVGDFNGDGIPDLAEADTLSGGVDVLLGNGAGGFTAAPGSPFAVGANPYAAGPYSTVPLSVAVGDFNGDGRQDLAVVVSGTFLSPGFVTVLLGNGAGSFTAAPDSPPVGFSPNSMAVGDFNGDGIQDLAVADLVSGVDVLLGNGTGAFTTAPGSPFASGSNPESVAVGDFNGDSKQDLAVANSGDNTVTVLLGNGSGGFAAAAGSPFAVGTSPQSVVVGDFNGDGIEDLATANGGSNDVTVLLGFFAVGNTPQTITFAPLSDLALGSPPPALGAMASSGLTVTFASNTPGVCTVSGTAVTILMSGGCSITANQPGNATYAAATPVTQSFTVLFADVPPGFDSTAVDLLAQLGITAGCGSDDFCPNDNITRAQMAIFVVRAVYGGNNFTTSATPYFNDVQPGDFGFEWIQKMYELGITKGCTATLYCPGEAVTRDQMAVFIIRARYGASASPDYPPAPYFTDVDSSDSGFAYVQRMKRNGITSGCTATTYCPGDPVTRGEMAVFIVRGAFNQLLPAGTPVISQISPATLAAGASGTFTITGTNTNFVAGTTMIGPIPGVAIGTITVTSPTSLTVQLTAAANATAQPYSILAITNTEEDVLPNGLTIQ